MSLHSNRVEPHDATPLSDRYSFADVGLDRCARIFPFRRLARLLRWVEGHSLCDCRRGANDLAGLWGEAKDERQLTPITRR